MGDIFNTLVTTLADYPDNLLQEAFPAFDVELKSRILGEIYRKSGTRRTHSCTEREISCWLSGSLRCSSEE